MANVTTRSTNNRIEDLESSVGSIERSLERIVQQIEDLKNEFVNRTNATNSSDEAMTTRVERGERNRGGQNRFLAVKGHKLEIPIFDGKDPDGWILRAERYFTLNQLSQEEKIDVSFVSFEGDALKWFQWEHKRHPITRWEDLKHLPLRQFRSLSADSLCEQFLSVRQEGSVEDYRRKFVEFAAPVDGIPKQVFLSQFINGLEESIKVELRLLDPLTLSEAMEVAMKIELKNKVLSREKNAGYGKKTGSSFYSNQESKSNFSSHGYNNVANSVNYPTIASKANTGFRRLSDQEVQQRRVLGLCYRCDEKYAPGHKCKKKEMSVLLVQDDVFEDTEPETEEKVCNTAKIVEKVEVHLNSVVGLTNPKTMKLEGKIEGQKVVVLIDSGATHNFISYDLVKRLNLKIEATGEYTITLGSGNVEKGSGICKGIMLSLPKVEIREDFLPLGLGNSNVILGMQWLETLGATYVNWKLQVMKFSCGGKSVMLKGDPSLGRSMVSLKTIGKMINHEGQGILVELGTCSVFSDNMEESNIVLEPLLREFESVFNMPQGLPPERGREHGIVLKEGTETINVRPYRYPYYQKDEIEKLVKEMLEAGVIQPSISPFSSPVNIVDKFLIPVIEELLDELHGATVFSKLDLKSGYHHIRMKEDVYKTAFRTHQGHYEFLVMPFGLVNALATFQGLMNEVFKKYLRKFVLLFANKKKCEFGRDRLGYLGHIISAKGVEVDPSKIAAVLEWVEPKSWTSEAQLAFDELKKTLSSTPVLRFPDFSKDFVVETDASGYGLGAVLMQEEQPIAYFSQALGLRAKQKSVYEKELMAIVLAIKKWRLYLLGKKFVVRTDQQSLRFLLEQRVVEPEYHKWASKLLGYDFSIVYKSGSSNQAADALSRKIDSVELANMVNFTWRNWDDLKQEIIGDSFLNRIKDDLSLEKAEHKGFEIQQDLLLYKGRLVIPRLSKMIPLIFEEFHGSPIGGHTGEDRTYQRIASEVF
ncbi:uncharacterized protein LOC112504018 [Cynara cardunculus var. scolymus]|uniref:uncharacterized protein LOC112504018 n=1 Tax=Cynara cardunculus var. scolymus TaxID=59895 RepID=UPI000D62DBDE|nr:uncharacterized protein LOC112504018 [Cynara cardunculus var. scolymus]